MTMMRRDLVGVAMLVMVGVALTVPRGADAERYTRKNLISTIKVEQTERTKKLAPNEAKKEAPSITADEFIAIQGLVRNIRQEQVKQYELLIADTDSNDPELPDLMFRLAEIHAQQQRYWQFRGMDMYKRIETAKKNEKSGLEAQQKKYFDASKESLLRAVKVYKQVADNPNFRNYPRMDMALYFYAYTLQNAKYASEARKILSRLIKDYPDSKYIPEAYLVFADYYFEQNSLANAERFYDKVLQFPKSVVYNFALYKKGWVYLNLERAQDALETFYDVVQRTRTNKKEENLNQAAKKDFVRAYAVIGKPQKAYAAFQRVDRGYAFNMLQILGDIYMEKGMAPKAIYTFRELIKINPKHENVCDWQYNITQAMLSAGSQDQVVAEVENLVKLYVAYKDKKILPAENLSECGQNAEGMNVEMAKIWHNEAVKTLNADTLAYVDKLYQLFLKSFPESEDYAEMQYFYAELMWRRAANEKNERLATELWEQTAVAFTDVVKSGKLKGEMLKEAAFASVQSWKNALAVDPRTNAPDIDEGKDSKDDKIPQPMEIQPREQKMIEAFDVYINYVKDPKDEELVMMKFLKARIYWRHNRYDEAVPLFDDIVKHHLEHETGEYSANLLLDVYNRTKRYEDMLQLVDYLSDKKKFLEDKDDLSERLSLLKRQSMRKGAEKLEADAKASGDFSKYIECGTRYLDIYNANTDAKDADVVLYNAGVCFEEGKSIAAAITMYDILSKRFPDSKQTQRAIVRQGKSYSRIAWYDEAAERYEVYAKRFGGEEDAYEALNDAVFYRKGIGDDDKAIADTEFFIKQYGKRKVEEAASAMFSMTSIYEKQGDEDKIIKHLRRYISAYGKKGGIDREIIAHAKIGMILWQQACPVRGVEGACIKVQRERSLLRRGKKGRRGSSLPKQCGPESKIKLTVVARDSRKMRAAAQEFKQAIRLFGNGAAVKKVGGDAAAQPVRTAAMVKFVAASKFHLAEADYEEFLAIKFPEKLDFDPRDASKKKKSEKAFLKWLKDKKGSAGGLYKQYDDIKNMLDASYAIAAAARAGQVSQNFSDALYTAEIPNDVRTGRFADEKVDAYCDALTTEAEPLENASIEAYGFCLGLSTKLNWFNQWSKLCERELGQIRPQDYPTASELRQEADDLAPVITVESPVNKLE